LPVLNLLLILSTFPGFVHSLAKMAVSS